MNEPRATFCLDDSVKIRRSKPGFHFLDNPVGVGATTIRLHIMYTNWDKSFWCGLGTCLGPGCLGPKPTTPPNPVLKVAESGYGIPGLEFPPKNIPSQSPTRQTRSLKISSLKYPCFIPPRSKRPSSHSQQSSSSNNKVIVCSWGWVGEYLGFVVTSW